MALHNNFDEKLLDGIVGVSYIGNPKDNTIMYLTKKIEGKIGGLANTKNALVFLENGVVVPDAIVDQNKYVFCDDPPSMYTCVVMKMAEKRDADLRKKKYTLTTDGYYVGEDVVLGKNAYIEPGVLIDHNVKIGDNTVVKAGAKIRFDTIIGDNCVIGENTVIGEPGFNAATMDNGDETIIPCFGRVIIEDGVYIGSSVTISKGVAGNTVIGHNVLVDSSCRIGHDAVISHHVEICGGTIVGGYVFVGNHTFVGNASVLKNRTYVGNDCFVGIGSVVIRNIKDSERVFGVPAKKILF